MTPVKSTFGKVARIAMFDALLATLKLVEQHLPPFMDYLSDLSEPGVHQHLYHSLFNFIVGRNPSTITGASANPPAVDLARLLEELGPLFEQVRIRLRGRKPIFCRHSGVR